MHSGRRAFFGTAALGAGGLLTLAGNAKAAAANPGDGGYGRQAVQLAPGDAVVHHNPGEVEAMPDFKHSLDAGKPKVTSGGWAKETTIENLPVATGLATVHMFLDPGASRELHWHAIAAEWAFVIDGRCQTMVLDPSGQSEVNNFGPGDLWFFPKGHGHSIHTIGDKPCHFVLMFDSGRFSEHGTFSITDWVSLTPPDMLAVNFGIQKDVFGSFPKGETYIMAGPVVSAAEARDAPWPKESTHKFSLRDSRARHNYDGGSLLLATVNEWPISKTMSGGLMTLKPAAIRELHWNPNADEMHYYLRGTGEVAIFGSGGRHKVVRVQPGDTVYVPAGFGHAVRNSGQEDLEVVLAWNAGEFQEINLVDWMSATPRYTLANNFGVQPQVFASFPEQSDIIRGD